LILQDYFYHRFTLNELSKKYDFSREWIQDKIHYFSPEISTRKPRAVTVVIDATYFGKREEKLGLIVAKDVLLKEPIAYNFIETETKQVYRDLITQISDKGFTLNAVILDGKPGIISLFEGIPVQMCHFHMRSIITRKLTRNPKLQASIELKYIVSHLGKVSACRFEYMLLAWHKRHELFLNEKVPNETKKGWHYKHKRLRSAYRSLMKFLPYLFTYLIYPNLNIPTTRNYLDGGCFSPLKDLLRVHRGIGVAMKRKLIVYFLESRVK
jgi:hypothetical protein